MNRGRSVARSGRAPPTTVLVRADAVSARIRVLRTAALPLTEQSIDTGELAGADLFLRGGDRLHERGPRLGGGLACLQITTSGLSELFYDPWRVLFLPL